jgi:hypothetical protein
MGFEPTILELELAKTVHILDLRATVIGWGKKYIWLQSATCKKIKKISDNVKCCLKFLLLLLQQEECH